MVLHPPSSYYHVLLCLIVLLLCGRNVIGQNNTGSQNETRSGDGPSYNFGSLDFKLKASLIDWGVRGASIAFYDKVGQKETNFGVNPCRLTNVVVVWID